MHTRPDPRDGWAATALIAWRVGRYVARKSECHRVYQELIGDEWTPLLTAIYEDCRQRWNYRIPIEPADRALLRRLCARALDFENAFLTAYKIYLLTNCAARTRRGVALRMRP